MYIIIQVIQNSRYDREWNHLRYVGITTKDTRYET